MSVWQRLFSTTPTPQRRDALEAAFISQSKALVEIVKQQQATLDRIVTAQYDRPLETVTQPQHVQMPEFMMNDQGDSMPDMSVDSDTAFLDSVGVK